MHRIDCERIATAALLIISFAANAQQPPPKNVQVAEVVRTEIAPTVSVPGTI